MRPDEDDSQGEDDTGIFGEALDDIVESVFGLSFTRVDLTRDTQALPDNAQALRALHENPADRSTTVAAPG